MDVSGACEHGYEVSGSMKGGKCLAERLEAS
jgi:hypothetical protein